MDRAFTVERITATKAEIIAYEEAITALGVGGATQSYTIDTTQSKQSVTRADIPALNRMLDSLYNRLATLQARLDGAVMTAGPAW